MAIFIVENSGKVSYGIKRYICKTMEDIPVEVNGEEIAPGSKIYVSDEKKTYMLNTAGQWVEITEGGGGGGASALGDLTDVDLTNLADGQVLKYDEDTQTWKPGDDASATSLGNLDDVDLTNLQDGQVIKYDGTNEEWVNADQDLIFVEIEETLLAGQTSLTFEDDRIVTTSKVELFSKEIANNDISYDDMTISTGRVVVTFPEQDSNLDVTLRLWLNNSGSLNVTYQSVKTLTSTLTAGQTTITFVDNAIVDNKAYLVGSSIFGVMPTNVEVTPNTNTLTATFNAQQEDIGVEVVII